MPVFSNAQTFPSINYYTTIYTRNGTSVEGIVYYPLSSQDYAVSLNYIQQYYPNVTILENPTSQYNCYSYAFHLSEGNTQKVWINPYTQSLQANLSKYWTDGSFIQVCNESDADKAYYYLGDHAALTTSSVSGEYESKWGPNCRVIHAPNYCPYDAPYYRRYYYASTKISGSTSNLCSGTRTFSVRNISGATYSWTKSSNLSVVGSGNSYQYSVQRNGSSSGAAWVEVQISTPCSPASSTQRINFGVGAPSSPSVYADWDNPLKIIAGADPVTGTTSYKWYVNNVYVKSTANPNTSLPYNGDCYTSVTVGVEVVTSCGTSGKTNTNIGTAPCGNFYIIVPNPAQDIITITTGGQRSMTAKAGTLSSPANSIAQIKIYNSNGIVIKSVQYNETRKQVQMNVADIAEGLYFIEVSNGNNKQTKKLIIAR